MYGWYSVHGRFGRFWYVWYSNYGSKGSGGEGVMVQTVVRLYTGTVVHKYDIEACA